MCALLHRNIIAPAIFYLFHSFAMFFSKFKFCAVSFDLALSYMQIAEISSHNAKKYSKIIQKEKRDN